AQSLKVYSVFGRKAVSLPLFFLTVVTHGRHNPYSFKPLRRSSRQDFARKTWAFLAGVRGWGVLGWTRRSARFRSAHKGDPHGEEITNLPGLRPRLGPRPEPPHVPQAAR